MNKNKYANSMLLSNTIWSFGAKIVAMIFYFVTDAIYARTLAIDQYAEWAFFFSIATMAFYIGWFGVCQSSKVYIAQSNQKEICLGAAFRVRILSSIGISFVIYLIAVIFDRVIHYTSNYENLNNLLYIMAGMVFFNSFTEFFKNIYVGIQDYHKLFYATSLEYIFYCLFSVAFLQWHLSTKSIAMAYCVAGLVLLGCNMFFISRSYKLRLVAEGRKDLELQKKIIRYAMPLILTSLGGLILTEMDTLMLGIMSTKQQLSVYSIAKQICSKSTHINMAIWTGTTTALAVITKENFKEKKKQFTKVNTANVGISVIVCLGLLVFGKIAISLVYGEEYIEAGTLVRYLIPYQLLYCISSFYANFLDFRGRAKVRGYWYMTVIALNLVLNYLLIPVMGATGAAIATSVSLIPYTIYCCVDIVTVFRELQKET